MNHQDIPTKEIIEKLQAAGKLQREALMLLMPESVRGHLEIIGQEVKAVTAELLLGVFFQKTGDTASPKAGEQKVKKFDIE